MRHRPPTRVPFLTEQRTMPTTQRARCVGCFPSRPRGRDVIEYYASAVSTPTSIGSFASRYSISLFRRVRMLIPSAAAA